MRIKLSILGRVALELTVGEADAQHVEDQTGYVVGFAPPPQIPAELDLPDRD